LTASLDVVQPTINMIAAISGINFISLSFRLQI
jgi:hypothetical protein